ncbi:MAG: hypothetical protein ACTSWP_04160 [Candidatus Freyarchaeota archaeon]|nr:hypothetical protein [Candidatus Freyrarchaeum guaymaensis]
MFAEACRTARGIVERHVGDNGEIIECKVDEGCIIDGGKPWFNIIRGYILETYCFTCKSVTFIRVLHEKDPRRNVEWVSVDVDENLKTPWFKE